MFHNIYQASHEGSGFFFYLQFPLLIIIIIIISNVNAKHGFEASSRPSPPTHFVNEGVTGVIGIFITNQLHNISLLNRIINRLD